MTFNPLYFRLKNLSLLFGGASSCVNRFLDEGLAGVDFGHKLLSVLHHALVEGFLDSAHLSRNHAVQGCVLCIHLADLPLLVKRDRSHHGEFVASNAADIEVVMSRQPITTHCELPINDLLIHHGSFLFLQGVHT